VITQIGIVITWIGRRDQTRLVPRFAGRGGQGEVTLGR